MLPWGLAKRGLSDLEPFHSLWRFLGTHWLSGSQMNDMLELLRHKINSDSELVKNTRITGIELLLKMEEEQQQQQTSKPEVRGQGQCKKIAAHRYLGAAWEEH
ncbi:hypothetical protein DFH08DRAFT_960023 [Mycena albidolilacea]|uniref:Uncharacterized protein n=1 Tax=Mycena albidolilacea TaxID=1033008 RepID=A0AAD7ESJ7_9AGAR|nr:hypothetical protein DFH08DRAFT_960023 [Mycena albidolilacea]